MHFCFFFFNFFLLDPDPGTGGKLNADPDSQPCLQLIQDRLTRIFGRKIGLGSRFFISFPASCVNVTFYDF